MTHREKRTSRGAAFPPVHPDFAPDSRFPPTVLGLVAALFPSLAPCALPQKTPSRTLAIGLGMHGGDLSRIEVDLRLRLSFRRSLGRHSFLATSFGRKIKAAEDLTSADRFIHGTTLLSPPALLR